MIIFSIASQIVHKLLFDNYLMFVKSVETLTFEYLVSFITLGELVSNLFYQTSCERNFLLSLDGLLHDVVFSRFLDISCIRSVQNRDISMVMLTFYLLLYSIVIAFFKCLIR